MLKQLMFKQHQNYVKADIQNILNRRPSYVWKFLSKLLLDQIVLDSEI